MIRLGGGAVMNRRGWTENEDLGKNMSWGHILLCVCRPTMTG